MLDPYLTLPYLTLHYLTLPYLTLPYLKVICVVDSDICVFIIVFTKALSNISLKHISVIAPYEHRVHSSCIREESGTRCDFGKSQNMCILVSVYEITSRGYPGHCRSCYSMMFGVRRRFAPSRASPVGGENDAGI
jgi:hypothetical protein